MTEHEEGETNGRIRLSFAQIVWGVAMLVAVVGAWVDLRSNVREIRLMVEDHRDRISALEQRNLEAGFTRQDAKEMKKDLLDEMRKRP